LVLNDTKRDGTSKLLAHELVHVLQYRQQGYLLFSFRYLWHYGRGMVRYRLRHRVAYRNIPAEVAAYAAADAWWKARTSDPRV
jgi:hypothetical protein